MEVYRGIKGDTFIDTVPVYKNDKREGRVEVVKIPGEWIQPGHETVVSFEFPASGDPGFNMSFSTIQPLEIVLEGFERLMDPSSPIYGNAYGIPLGMRDRRLAELPRLLQKPHREDKVNLSVMPGNGSAKIKYFWYNSRHSIPWLPPKPRFEFNIGCYDKEVFETAYLLTDFPITKTEKRELEELFLRFQRLGHE